MKYTPAATTLFLLQVLAHLGLLYGLFTFEAVEWLVVAVIYFFTGCIGVSITLHRYMSHASFKMPRYMEMFGVFCSTYGLIGSSLAWVNNHRAHHRYTDKDGDPHSPIVYGFIKVQWASMFLSATTFKYIRKYINDPFHVFMHKNYFVIHFTIIALWFIMFGWHELALYYLAPAAVLWNAGSFINTIGHLFGYRNHDTKDNSVNNPVLGYLVWGEGWHNNHHYMPARESFSEKWYEFDISQQVIKVLKKLPGDKQ